MKALQDMTLEELWQLFPIVLKPHNPEYALWYDEAKELLLRVLKDYPIYRIHHIGSTSVRGLIAKPIIDILLELPQTCDFGKVSRLLQNNGWIEMARNDVNHTIDLNQGYTPNGFAQKVYHLHIKIPGDWGELYFRDYLRMHSDAARQYEALKRCLKEQYEHNRDAYTHAKSDFIMKHTQKAREELGPRYVPEN